MALSRAGLEELGLHEASAWMALMDAQAEMLAGNPAAAASAARDTERITRAIGDRWFLSAALVDYAHALLAQDRRRRRGGGRRGHRHRPRAERHGVADQAPHRPCKARRPPGRSRARPDRGRARPSSSRTEPTSSSFERTPTASSRSVLLSAGKPHEAERAAERSLELCEAKENVAAASRRPPATALLGGCLDAEA